MKRNQGLGTLLGIPIIVVLAGMGMVFIYTLPDSTFKGLLVVGLLFSGFALAILSVLWMKKTDD